MAGIRSTPDDKETRIYPGRKQESTMPRTEVVPRLIQQIYRARPEFNLSKIITNKTMWSGDLRIAMREIPEEDYRLILKRAGAET